MLLHAPWTDDAIAEGRPVCEDERVHVRNTISIDKILYIRSVSDSNYCKLNFMIYIIAERYISAS